MPLAGGYSRRTIGQNIRRERRRGKKPPQAVAVAYSEARRSWRKRHPHGPFPRILTRRVNPGGSLLPLLAIGAGLFALAQISQHPQVDVVLIEPSAG